MNLVEMPLPEMPVVPPPAVHVCGTPTLRARHFATLLRALAAVVDAGTVTVADLATVATDIAVLSERDRCHRCGNPLQSTYRVEAVA